MDEVAVAAFVAAAGYERGSVPEVTWFGDDVAMQTALAELVVAGIKRATTSLLKWYGEGREPLPRAGDLFVVVDGGGTPRCICRNRSIAVRRFRDVGGEYAWEEGENDRTLQSWRRQHAAFFAREAARSGTTFDEALEVVLQPFDVVWTPPSGRLLTAQRGNRA